MTFSIDPSIGKVRQMRRASDGLTGYPPSFSVGTSGPPHPAQPLQCGGDPALLASANPGYFHRQGVAGHLVNRRFSSRWKGICDRYFAEIRADLVLPGVAFVSGFLLRHDVLLL